MLVLVAVEDLFVVKIAAPFVGLAKVGAEQ